MTYDLSQTRGWRCRPDVLRGALPVIDLFACAMLVAVFWSYLQSARALPPPMNKIDPGPGGFPYMLAIAALLALGAVALSAVIRLTDKAPVEWVSIRRPLWVALTMVLLTLQSIYLEALGALPTVLALSVGIMIACGERRIAHLAGVPLALAAFIYGVFVLALQVNLP
ncbi:tripartite tricarboxylate transporter TctB family protein [Phaeovulum sp. W22_SRMD_FR3]|uniref:tripartite tricarboxylate transporter TctB family protein n=1 Tax=Phaeovulum sp. W22_SRMD_FR3 TaxID=3240274 RepID=UPI003F94E967